MKLSSKWATLLNPLSYFLNGFHILFSLLQSKQLLWQSYLPAVHSLCDHSYPHRRHLGLHPLLDESESICLHHWNEILLIFAELLGPWFKCWEKGRLSHRAAYAIIRSCSHSTQGDQRRERCVASYLCQHTHLVLVPLPPCSKNPHTQVYSTQCCLEGPHNLKVLFKICSPPQKRCSSEFKNCDKAAYNVTYPIVYHVVTWVPLIVGQNHAGKCTRKDKLCLNTLYWRSSEDQHLESKRKKLWSCIYWLIFLVCAITTTPCLNGGIVLKNLERQMFPLSIGGLYSLWSATVCC